MTPASQAHHAATQITVPYEGNALDITIIVPCFNHAGTIIDTLNTIHEAMDIVEKSYEIMVIDDGSQDDTLEVLREYIAANPHVNLLVCLNHHRKGEVQCYIDGAFIGKGKYYRMVHADDSESVETMTDILRSLGEADIIAPYFVSMHKQSLWARFSNGIYYWCLNHISGHDVKLYESLHVHLRYNVMRWRPITQGSLFQLDLLYQLLDYGFTCKPVPCRAVPQCLAPSILKRFRHMLSAVHTLMGVAMRRMARQIPSE